jgi:hypothetical protein
MKAIFSFATAVGILLGASAAQAATVVDNFSGTFGNGVGAVSGQITLDVVAGKAISGSGFIDISNLALSNAPLVLITTSTPGNETAGGPAYPVGFRANDGTDLFGLDQKFPLDTAGLLFDVGTATAVWGKYPLINLASGAGNSVFDGKVGGTEYYVAFGTVGLSSAVPEPSTWAMMLIGFAGLGFASYRRAKLSGITSSATV